MVEGGSSSPRFSMEGEGFLSNLLLNGEYGAAVAGLDDLVIPTTQEDGSSDEVVEVEPSRCANGGAKRKSNFSAKEDDVVVSAWLNISKDAINGANQTRSRFWVKVHEFYDKNRGTHAWRSESSVMHRWLNIQTEVNKFCAYYDQIEGRNQSGTTVKDWISGALKMYQELHPKKKQFTLIPCWNVLKEEDKWKAKRVELAEIEKQEKELGKKKRKVAKPKEVDVTNTNEGPHAVQDEPEAKKRSMGVKKAKEAARRGGGDACVEALDKMWVKKEAFDKEKEKAKEERFMASLEVDKAALELQKKFVENEAKKAEADLMKEENGIMFVDKKSLDPLQLQYVEVMQKKIIARRMEN